MAFDDNVLETRLVRVRGQVQGIGYREACARRAIDSSEPYFTVAATNRR
jgi:acylphosphatase